MEKGFIKKVEFKADNLYIIAENYPEPAETKVLFETTADRITVEECQANVNFEQFYGKGFGIYICYPIESIECNMDRGEDKVIFIQDHEACGFEIVEYLADFPLIEGVLMPGIYGDEELGKYYMINSIQDLDEIYNLLSEESMQYNQFKIICKNDRLETVELNKSNESVWSQVPFHPFTYFDINCPLCSKKVMTYRFVSNYSPQILYKELKCPHYIGCVEKEDNIIISDTLRDLGIIYRLDGEDLFIMTENGWKRPLLYEPAYDPTNSFWGKSQDEGFQDVFVFLEGNK